MEPRLSQYTNFFLTLSMLETEGTVSGLEAITLRQLVAQKDPSLLSLLGACSKKGNDPALKSLILKYLQDLHKPCFLASKEIQKTSKFSVSARQLSVNFDTQLEKPPHRISVHLDSLMRQFYQIVKDNPSQQDRRKLLSFRDWLTDYLNGDNVVEDTDSSPKVCLNCMKVSGHEEVLEFKQLEQINSGQILQDIKSIYKELKQLFQGSLQTHQLLMKEEISSSNLFSVVKSMIKRLTDSDNIMFFVKRNNQWDFYSTEEDMLQFIDPEKGLNFLNHFSKHKPNYIHNFKSHLQDQELLQRILGKKQDKVYAEMSLVRFVSSNLNSEVYFFFTWDEQEDTLQRRFVNQANEYGYRDEVVSLATFLVDVIIQARIQYFNPLQFSDQIQDIALSFVGVSRYLLVDGISKALENSFLVRREQTFSELGEVRQCGENEVYIDMECRNPITLIISGMRLQRPQDAKIYSKIVKVQQKFEQYLRLCHEKTAYYKYFIRSSDSIVFDFDTKGRLLFLSHPIWPSLKEKYKINFSPEDQRQTYSSLFEDTRILNLIDLDEFSKKKKNQYIQNDEFEIFLKVVDQKFKGFVITFHLQENKRVKQYIKNLRNDREFENEVKKTLQRSINKQQTFKFINQLEQNNPGVKNSMLSLFIPEEQGLSPELQPGPRKYRVSISLIGNGPIKQFNNTSTSQRIKSIESAKESEEEDQVIESMNLDPLVDMFTFNIFLYDKKLKQKVAYHIIKQNEWIETFAIDKQNLMNFIGQLERKYNKRSNPFHNFDHGVSVMQCAHYLCQLPTINLILPELHVFATVVSGLCHDVDHTGRTNQFEINSKSKLGLRYLERSPLEQHHAATTLKLLSDPDMNIIAGLCNPDQQSFRQVLIENILYTDIKQHFALTKDFEARFKESQEHPDKYFGSVDGDLKLLTGMIIHSSDFGGAAKMFEVSRQWTDRVNNEFMEQYAEEGRLGIPQTPFFKDLDNNMIKAKSEMGFFKVIVRPLWALLNDFCNNDLHDVMGNLDDTILSWEKIYNESKSAKTIET